MQYAGNLKRFTRLSVTGHSQPLINTKYQIPSNKLIVNNNALLCTYELTTDWTATATVYSGMTLKWDYENRTCDISMPGYVSNVLSKFQHDAPKHPQHTPSRYVTPVYGAKTHYATKDETATHGPTMSHNTESHRIRFVLRQSGGPNRFNATE
jgi:hypothetical protein